MGCQFHSRPHQPLLQRHGGASAVLLVYATRLSLMLSADEELDLVAPVAWQLPAAVGSQRRLVERASATLGSRPPPPTQAHGLSRSEADSAAGSKDGTE
jgi:hypothetical protein